MMDTAPVFIPTDILDPFVHVRSAPMIVDRLDLVDRVAYSVLLVQALETNCLSIIF
jgi:hypothetical protein